MKRITAVLFVTAALTGCAAGPTYNHVVIDTRDVDQRQYQQDLIECRRYADQVSVGSSAAGGAISGAIFGMAIGAILGNSDLAMQSAGIGAVSGGASAAGASMKSKADISKQCLRGRGYSVLN